MILQPYHTSSRPQNLGSKITLWNNSKHALSGLHMKTLPRPPRSTHKNLPPEPLRFTQTFLMTLGPHLKSACHTPCRRVTHKPRFCLSHKLLATVTPRRGFHRQHSQRWCLVFLRHMLPTHFKQIHSQEFWTLYLPPQLSFFLGSQPHTTRNHVPYTSYTTAQATRPPEPSVRRDLAWNKTLLPQKINMTEKLTTSPEKAATENRNTISKTYSKNNQQEINILTSLHVMKNLQCIQTSDLSPPLQKLALDHL